MPVTKFHFESITPFFKAYSFKTETESILGVTEWDSKSTLGVKTGKPSEMYDMVHTENFVLVDAKRQVRGFYDGTNLDGPTEDGVKNVKQLLEDILFLCGDKK